METLSDFHLGIQYAVRRLSDPDLTFEVLGREYDISKQAAQKQYKKALEYLRAYPGREANPVAACTECGRRQDLVANLRRQLILQGAKLSGLRFFKEQVLKILPNFKSTRLPPFEKKQILDWLDKFKKAGGFVKDFAKGIGRSPETLARWQAAYDKHGLAGLANKSTRPKNFGNRVPLWIKKHLLLLFMQFPRWTPYQYHSHIRHNPATNWYVSLPVIDRLKAMHVQKTQAEIERIRKRWCFQPGTKAWTVDFVCIFKTENYKLQILTISDHRSRYLIDAVLYLNTSTEAVIRHLEELFIKYGKPYIIKADNGPEFRMEMREGLNELAVYLLNNPNYYGQFNGAHERIHRKLRAFIEPFANHQNINRLVLEILEFKEQYNHQMPMDSLDGKRPADIFLEADEAFVPDGAEVVTPYEKDGELRMKFINRDGDPARIALPLIQQDS